MEGLAAVFTWSGAASALWKFGGTPITLFVTKTGLPFFDALRLYGSIDLYIGLREDVCIHDAGTKWEVKGRSRAHRLAGKDEYAMGGVWKNREPDRRQYCALLRSSLLTEGAMLENKNWVDGKGDWDAALQDGIRGVSARAYETLQSGQTSKPECKAKVPLPDALLAYAGKSRTERQGDILFLPIFEGRVDLSKVVSPVRAWLRPPHVLCAQALMLLSLKTALFAEGYHRAISGVVFNTDFDSRKRDNFSGLVTIGSTAIGRIDSPGFVGHAYRVFLTLVSEAWDRRGRTTRFYPHALSMTHWLMQPAVKHLSVMITSQEMLLRDGRHQLFARADYLKEVFTMTYESWEGDYEAVRRFAKAVASGIYFARMAKENTFEDKGKAWYDEVTLLRSASSARAFLEKALILIEQGHREHAETGTTHRDEAFNPQLLVASIGNDRVRFEAFRDLFRMYLIQASTYKPRDSGETDPVPNSGQDNLPAPKEELQ